MLILCILTGKLGGGIRKLGGGNFLRLFFNSYVRKLGRGNLLYISITLFILVN